MMRSVSMLSPRSGKPGRRDGSDFLDGHQLNGPRTSTTSPASAAAATIAGLISSVLPVGLPCLPLKFRFEEEAQTSSAFEAIGVHRQAHRAAGAPPLEAGLDEHAIEPLALRGQPHPCEPGTTSALTCGAT